MPLRRRLKNFFKQYSDVIVKVREATSNDPWGPSGNLMTEIAEMTYRKDLLPEITQVIGQRLNDSGKNWRHVFKSLVLLDYLIKNGSQQVILFCHERAFDIQLLNEFKYIDKTGQDQGVHVRRKSRKIIDLLTDEKSLKLEREKAEHVKLRMLCSTPRSKYKLLPKGSKLENLREKQKVQRIEKTAIDSPSEKISSIQPIQDLMICEDKSQLLHLSSEDQQAAPIPLELVESPPDPLKEDLKKSGFQSVLLKSKIDTGETKLQPVPFYKSSPVHGNTTDGRTKNIQESKENNSSKSCQTKTVSWVDELKKIHYPVSSQPLPSDFTVPRLKSPATLPKQDKLPPANVSPTPMTSLSIPAKPAFNPWENEIPNLPVTARYPAPEPSTFSQFTINPGFEFNTQMPNKPMINYSTWATTKMSYKPSNHLGQPTMPTGPLSTIQYRPYLGTNPFLSPAMPAVREQFTDEVAAAPSIERFSSIHRPPWLELTCSALYPTSSLQRVALNSFQSTNPQYPGLESRMTSIIPSSMGVQRPLPTSVFSVVPSHCTNPFL
ncbi:ENTH domain-containing protein 1 isoform 1-T2 [Anomaloglossus baeobatrachus]|uniref:ENTH domain-containing protein 1 n=1 Tax=Anomaloglossus baeobatrachus TaxID=238106 RepID=UPI003F504D0F